MSTPTFLKLSRNVDESLASRQDTSPPAANGDPLAGPADASAAGAGEHITDSYGTTFPNYSSFINHDTFAMKEMSSKAGGEDQSAGHDAFSDLGSDLFSIGE